MAEEKKYEYVLPKGCELKSGVGEYKIIKALGQGGFGITYQAKGRRKGDNVFHMYAIKEFFVKGQCWREDGKLEMKYSPAAHQEMKENLKDFVDEANRLNKICRGNRNIVNVNEVFQANGTAYYVMEYLEGGSLRDKVREVGGGLSEGVAISYIRPIAEAVEYIHSQYQLLHCDIKPDNIMLRFDEDGNPTEPVLIDFGISIHFDKKGELTSTHTAIGVSPGYSPLEQFKGLKEILEERKKLQHEGVAHLPLVPFEMDVYALGATLYYLLMGKNPDSAAFGLDNILAKRLAQTSISDKTKTVILEAMRQDPVKRTKTAAAFLKGFEERYYLPAYFVLKSPNTSYSIIGGVQDESPCYIKYAAVVFTGQTPNRNVGGSTTFSRRYDVYEFFERGRSKRMDDESVSNAGDRSALSNFYQSVRDCTGLKVLDQCVKQEDMILRERFNTNGTTYVVVRQGVKPKSPLLAWWNDLVDKMHLKGGTIAKYAAIAVGVVVLGFVCNMVVDAIKRSSERQRLEEKKYSAMLSDAIEKNDSSTLAMFAEKDSLRAYLPLAKICLNANDTVGARKYAQLLFNQQADSELAKEILAKIEEMKQQKEGEQKVDQEAPVTQQPTQANPDNDQSKEEAAKKQEEERKRQEAERKKQEAKKAAEEQLETALRNQDWKTLERLANQGNTRASDALAEHYVNAVDNLENNQQAEKWANKASTTVRRKVRHILYLRGYLTEDN